MTKVHLVSLGCAKNLVDSEVMLGVLENAGWQITDSPEESNVLLINTCGFIQPAVEEAIEEILELSKYKEDDPAKKLVVTGCMVQRYKDGLISELPEVDLFVGTEGILDIVKYIEGLGEKTETASLKLPPRMLMDSTMPRRVSTPFYRSWLKITEGCDNRCSYCMIPSIRGDLRSRSMSDLVVESTRLEQGGVKELCLIAQDLTAYGDDLLANTNITQLLHELIAGTTIPWLRLLYLYPSGITDELISIIADNERIVPYLDIPFQHVSDSVLARMNRRYTNKSLYELIEKLRNKIPHLSLRTTFLLGFPGETDSDILELEKFIQDVQFDHLGVFGYANENGCPSEKFDKQCGKDVKQQRVDHIMSVQSNISQNKLKRYIGQTMSVLVEGVSRESDLLLEGRTKFQAPDIDGCVYITEGNVNQGDIVDVEITDAQVYDLVGKVV